MRTGIWISKEIESLKLNATETKLLAEIVSLNERGKCFASNRYFAEIMGLKPDTVSGIISKLKKRGLVKQTGFDGRRRYLVPCLPSVPIERGSVKPSESASDFLPGPFNITKEIKVQVQKPTWEKFRDWATKTLSLDSRGIIARIQSPDELPDRLRIHWERFSRSNTNSEFAFNTT